MPESLDSQVRRATKWSAITEIAAKLVSPIVSIVLARLLTPEAFGIVATLAMVISFAEVFTDAGFQKYLIQHDFKDDDDKYESTDIAFWSNLGMSLLIWALIAVFSAPIAALVGNPGLGGVLVIACVSIPLAAFSSIQTALYKRDLDFKTIFKVKFVAMLIPLVVTVPLALALRSFWALVIGTIIQNLSNAVLLSWYSKWKPRLRYSFAKLKEMLSFTLWSILESVSVWLTGYVDVFLVGRALGEHYLGLYKNSSTLVGQIMGLVTAATTPVLFSSLSRLQNDGKAFREFFLRFQKNVGLLVIPMGVGIWCYGDFITSLLLGSQWTEAAGFIGLWGLMSALTIVLAHYSTEAFRAIGRPKLSVLAQVLYFAALVPTVLIALRYDFRTLYTARSLVRLEIVLVNLIIMYAVVRISPWKMIGNIFPSLAASAVMAAFAFVARPLTGGGVAAELLTILACVAVYFGLLMIFPKERAAVLGFFRKKND